MRINFAICTNNSFCSKSSFRKKFKKCTYSGEQFEQRDTATIEHIIPKVRGGKNEYANYLIVKRSWNMDRSDIPLSEYIDKNPNVKQNIIDTVNSKEGQIIEGICWSDEVKKTLLKEIGYDIFKE